MPVPLDGNNLSLGKIRQELESYNVSNDYDDGPYTSGQTGLNAAETDAYITVNQDNIYKPNGASPSAMSEWQGYNHLIDGPITFFQNLSTSQVNIGSSLASQETWVWLVSNEVSASLSTYNPNNTWVTNLWFDAVFVNQQTAATRLDPPGRNAYGQNLLNAHSSIGYLNAIFIEVAPFAGSDSALENTSRTATILVTLPNTQSTFFNVNQAYHYTPAEDPDFTFG